MKKSKGFTLAELLIVVAIIAVLVAISIPVFTSQLEKSRDAVTEANVRAAYAEAATKFLMDEGTSSNAVTEKVIVKGEKSNGYFESTELPFDLTSGLKTTLDKSAGSVNVKFTWSINSKGESTKVTASVGS